MSKLLHSVDQRTKLVGENRLEVLMFKLAGRQTFALNVFKIKEVLPRQALNLLPHSHPKITGVLHIRNQTIPVIDLASAIGSRSLEEREDTNLIVTEYNRSVQAFLVGKVDRIVNMNWDEIMPPPSGLGRENYLTAITKIEEQIVEILDVERVLADIIPYNTEVAEEVLDRELVEYAQANRLKVLLAEDSSTAVTQVTETLQHLGIQTIAKSDGLKALEFLKALVAEGRDVYQEIFLVITDAEMPEMDGYRLTHEIRNHPDLKELKVILHTSLSGNFNEALVQKVGCDDFISKFQPDELAKSVQKYLREWLTQG